MQIKYTSNAQRMQMAADAVVTAATAVAAATSVAASAAVAAAAVNCQ